MIICFMNFYILKFKCKYLKDIYDVDYNYIVLKFLIKFYYFYQV